MMKKNHGLVTGWPERRITKITALFPLGTHHTSYLPESLGVTLGDKKFKTGYAKGFPSSKPMQVSDQDSGSSKSEEVSFSDEEFPSQKWKHF